MSITDWQKSLADTGFHNFTSELYENDPLLFTLETQKHVDAVLGGGESQFTVFGFNFSQKLPLVDHTDKHEAVLFHYRRGKEGDLRKLLLEEDNSEFTLWLYTEAGSNGDAGIGLCRSLKYEYPLCKIFLVIFDGGVWTVETMSSYISTMNTGDDSIFYVDCHGQVTVPRIVKSLVPTKHSRFDAQGSWKLDQTGFKMNSLPELQPNAVIVKSIAFSPPLAGLRAFVGHCEFVGERSSFAKGDLVIGIDRLPDVSNMFMTGDHLILKLEPELESLSLNIVGNITALFIAHIGLGKRRRANSRSKILLVRDDDSNNANPTMRWYLDSLGYHVLEWEPKLSSPADLHELVSKSVCILSGTTQPEIMKMLKMSRRRATRLFLWNDLDNECNEIIDEDPTIIYKSLREILLNMDGKWNNIPEGELIHVKKLVLPSQGDMVPLATTLFDPTKAYILIGGIGGVGIRIALWMYQVRLFKSIF